MVGSHGLLGRGVVGGDGAVRVGHQTAVADGGGVGVAVGEGVESLGRGAGDGGGSDSSRLKGNDR